MKHQKGCIDIIIIIVIVAFLTVFLACKAKLSRKVEEKQAKTEFMQEVTSCLTATEMLLVNNYQNRRDAFAEDHGYGGSILWTSLITKRAIVPYTNIDVPFCDVISILEQTETSEWASVREGISLLTQWETLGFGPLKDACASYNSVVEQPEEMSVGGSEGVEVIVSEEEEHQKVVEASVVIDKESLLSPAKVRELSVSAKECNRTKNKLLELTEGGRYLTSKDYNEVTKLILDCDNLQLQIELNK